MNGRALVVVNPAAGNGRAARVWQQLHGEFPGWEHVTTERPGHARELAACAATAGYERVIAIGGDGTLYEVANGLAHSDTALGSIPAGTGSDCARSLGIPADPMAAARLATTGQPRPIDLGEIRTAEGTTLFLNVAGFGFDAEVAWRVNRLPKIGGGTVPYVLGVLQTLWSYRSPPMRIVLDNERHVDKPVFMVAVANNPSYGGGMLIAPDARPDDGLFDVCVVSDVSRLEVLRLVPRMYSGGHRGHPAVEFFRCREVQVDSNERVRCHADGELVGEVPARFSVRPGGLRCVTG